MERITLTNEMRDLYEPQIEQLGLDVVEKDGYVKAEAVDDECGYRKIIAVPLFQDCAAFLIAIQPKTELAILPKSVDHGCISRMSFDSARHLFAHRGELPLQQDNYAAYSCTDEQGVFSITPGERYESTSLCFTHSFLERVEGKYGHDLCSLFANMPMLARDQLPSELLALMAGLSGEHLGSPGSLMYYRAKLFEAIAILVDSIDSLRCAHQRKEEKLQRHIVGQAKRIISHNLDSRLTVDEIASRLFVSRSYLSAAFSEETGTSIGAWAKEQRMIHARMMLSCQESSISHVAKAVGFEHTSSFCKAFKLSTGLTPTQWRQL